MGESSLFSQGWFIKKTAEGWEMARSVRCLLYKQEVLLGTHVSPGTVPMAPPHTPPTRPRGQRDRRSPVDCGPNR